MLEVTTTVSYAGSQALGEVCHRLVDVFLWVAAILRWSVGRLSTYQSFLGFGWSL